VTVGVDFLLDRDGWLLPWVGRAKVDVDCYGRPQSDVLLELERLARAYDLDHGELAPCLTDLDECLGGLAIHYTSVGLRDGPAHLTVYAQPAGYAIE
jgi:hypothetical protein